MTNACLEELKTLRARWGYGEFDAAVKKLNRERLEQAHPKRDHVTTAQRNKMYVRQHGLCSICGQDMKLSEQLDVDHVNVNAEEYNSPRNKKLAHASCNRSKGARDLVEQSKHSGRTVLEQLGDEI